MTLRISVIFFCLLLDFFQKFGYLLLYTVFLPPVPGWRNGRRSRLKICFPQGVRVRSPSRVPHFLREQYLTKSKYQLKTSVFSWYFFFLYWSFCTAKTVLLSWAGCRRMNASALHRSAPRRSPSRGPFSSSNHTIFPHLFPIMFFGGWVRCAMRGDFDISTVPRYLKNQYSGYRGKHRLKSNWEFQLYEHWSNRRMR